MSLLCAKIKKTKDRLAQFRVMGIKPNFSKIAEETGLDRHTVSKMYKNKEVKLKRNKPSVLDKYQDEIKALLGDPSVSITAAYFYLTDKARGEKQIQCTLSNFTKYVEKHKLNVKTPGYVAHVLFETDPGVQIQFDWVEDLKIHTINGVLINFNLFSATLGYSRMHYFEFTSTITETDIKRCLLHAFEYFGGTTKEALTDNMTAIVNIQKNEKNVHPSIQQFFKDINVKLRLCKPRSPQTKGKCETANKYAQWLRPYDHKIKDEIDLFNVIYRLNSNINKKVNTRTNRPPIVLFETEKGALNQLNKDILLERNKKFLKVETVPQTSLVYYKGNHYSVNPKFIGKRVYLTADNDTLSILYNSVVIATHHITDKKINYREEDYKAGLMGKIKPGDIDKICEENLRRFK